MRHILISTVSLVVFCISITARAEVFVLTTGGQIEGSWLNKNQSPRKDYAVQIATGGRVVLDKAMVDQVIAKSESQTWYEKIQPEMPNTLEAHWQMADECEKRKLSQERDFHLNAVLGFDPDHVAARQKLGFSRINGNWVRPDEEMLKKGYVRFQGRWRLPQEIEIESRRETKGQQEGEWRKKIKMWRGWIVRGRDKVMEAERQFLEIRDPIAAKPLAELLDEDREPVRLKLLYIETLSRLPTGTSTAALVKRSLYDPDVNVRDRATDGLLKIGSRDIVPVLVKALKHEENVVVHRAALVLGRMKAKEATLPLIDALTTKHRKVISPPGGQTTAVFDKNGGGGGLSMGGGPKIVELELRNDTVLAALATIHTGTNIGYDKLAWRSWYALQQTPKEVSLRRGE